MVDENEEYPSLEIRKLYPHLTFSQLLEAKKNLAAYTEVILGIYERIRKDPEAYAKFKAELAAAKGRIGN